MQHVHIQVHFACKWHREENWNAPYYNNPYTTAWLIQHGHRIIQFNRQSYSLRPGDLIFIPPNSTFVTQFLQQNGPEPIQYFAMGFTAKLSSIEWTKLFGIPSYIPASSLESITELAQKWQDVIKANTAWDDIMNSNHHQTNIDSLLRQIDLETSSLQWFRETIHLLRHVMRNPNPYIDERISVVCTYIKEQLHRPIKVKDLATIAKVSEGHLRLLFRKEMGISPYQYLLQAKIEKAKELLLFSGDPLAEIAAQIGFDEYNHFLAVFRKMVGCTPSWYRKHANIGT